MKSSGSVGHDGPTIDAVEHLRSAEARVWTVSEAAVLLGISRAHAYELVARNVLRHVRLGRRVVIPKNAVDELLDHPAGKDRAADW